VNQDRPGDAVDSGGRGAVTRRTAVRAGIVGLSSVVSVAGCLGESASGGGDDLRVDTLAIGGSPGEEVPVRPDGRVVLLDFFATWCPSCKAQMSNFRTLAERYPELHLLSITWEDDASAVRGFWSRHRGTWPVATDPQMRTGQAFGVDTVPTMLLFDAEGRQVWQDTGLASVASMAEAVERAMS
jgi:Thiol-disulfide isomerase and thioredoxins